MNVAVYYCKTHEAMVELLGNLDTGESMEVACGNNGWIVTYKSPHLSRAATDPDIENCYLRFQERC